MGKDLPKKIHKLHEESHSGYGVFLWRHSLKGTLMLFTSFGKIVCWRDYCYIITILKNLSVQVEYSWCCNTEPDPRSKKTMNEITKVGLVNENDDELYVFIVKYTIPR